MKNTTKKEHSLPNWVYKREISYKSVSLLLVALFFLWGCQKKPAPPAPPPFSMDRLAHLYVQARLFELASGNPAVKQDTLRWLLKQEKLSSDSVQSILAYFKTNPQAWVLFYKKVETFSRLKPPARVRKKNPVPK